MWWRSGEKRLRTARRRVDSHCIFEPVESRTLLSAVLDLRLAGGGKAAEVSSAGETIHLELWAIVSGTNSSGADEAIQSVVGSLLSTDVGVGAARGHLAITPVAPFDGAGSSAGAGVDLDGDGDLDVGSNNDSAAGGFFAARSSQLVASGGVMAGGSQSFKIADATFTVTELPGGTQTEINFRPRSADTAALWVEDGQMQDLSTGSLMAGTPVVVSVGQQGDAGSISIADAQLVEGDAGWANMRFTVVRSGELSGPLTVQYATANGTAKAGEDFIARSGSISFAPGASEAEIEIPIIGEKLFERDETLSVSITGVSDAAVQITRASAVGRILNDDAPPSVRFAAAGQSVGESAVSVTVTAELTGPSYMETVVPFGIGGSAEAGADYIPPAGSFVFAPGSTTASVTISLISDGIDEPDETIVLALEESDAAGVVEPLTHTITLQSDEQSLPVVSVSALQPSASEAGPVAGAFRITATLQGPAAETTTLSISHIFGGTAASGVDYLALPNFTQIVIPAGSATGTADLVVMPIDDALVEGSESVVLTLVAGNSQYAFGSPAIASIQIADNDLPTAQFSVRGQTVGENAGTLTVQVNLSSAYDQPVTVPLIFGGTAVAGVDYIAPADFVTIAAGETSAAMVITLVDDEADEPMETLALSMGTPTNATAGKITLHTVKILDKSEPPAVQFIVTEQSAAENSETVTVVVQLSAPASSDVRVPFVMRGSATFPADYTITPSPLLIPAGSTTATITINLTDDALHEADETIELELSAPKGASLGDVANYALTVVDDDAPPAVFFAQAEQSVQESAGKVTVTAQLSAPAGRDVVVPFSVSGPAGVQAPSGPMVIKAGATFGQVQISFADNQVHEPDRTLTVTLGTPEHGRLESPFVHTVTIADDDAAAQDPKKSLHRVRRKRMVELETDTKKAINFGTLAKGTKGTIETFEITNTGDSVLSLGRVRVPEGFKLVKAPKRELMPGETARFKVQLRTGKVGKQTGKIRISSNDPDVPLFKIKVAGKVKRVRNL